MSRKEDCDLPGSFFLRKTEKLLLFSQMCGMVDSSELGKRRGIVVSGIWVGL